MMSQVVLEAESAASEESINRSPMPLAVALVSFASLLLELSLTRLFSVVLFYHFAFLSVSIALLGLGAGGVFAYVRKQWLERWSIAQLGGRMCLLAAAAIVVALAIVLHDPVSLGLTWQNFGRLTLLYCASAVPFFFAGLLLATTFARRASDVTLLYGSDLMGGAAACLAVVPLLNLIGAPNAVLFAALAMAIAALQWSRMDPANRLRRVSLVAVAILPLLIAANFSGAIFDVVYAKGAKLDRSKRLYSRWNAISRIEVSRVGQSLYIVIDADANSAIMGVDPHAWHGTVWQHDLMAAAPAVANVLRPKGAYAIIGPGGGVDVLRAIANGSPRVVGIEINPIIVNNVMRGRFADYAHHLYEVPEVEMHVSDGRSWIRASRERFDVVEMTLVDTWASTAAGAFALSENNLYTREAFREYFQHLKPGGVLAITRWEFRRPREALRVVAEAIDALTSLGVPQQELAQHFIVVSDGKLDEDGRPVTVLASRSPFTQNDEQGVTRHLRDNPGLFLLYVPSLRDSNAFADLIRSGNPETFAATYDYNVSPVDDNAPFFFFTMKTSDMLRNLIAGTGRGMDWRINLGVVVLGIVLIISIVAVMLFLITPLALTSRAGNATAQWPALFYFVALGLGYILVEIAFIQRFVLFLGHPTYALTVVVFLMLLSSGGGSMVARHWFSAGARLWLAPLIIAAALVIYRILLPAMLSGLVGLPFAAKLLISAATLVPLGFCMGMPFPLGLEALATRAQQQGSANTTIEWAWAMNAAASVLGSVAAMVIAIHWGLNTTLLAGSASYGAAMLLARNTLQARAPDQ